MNLQNVQLLKLKDIFRYVTSEIVPAKEEMFEQSAFLETGWNISGETVGLESDQLKVSRVLANMHRERAVQLV